MNALARRQPAHYTPYDLHLTTKQAAQSHNYDDATVASCSPSGCRPCRCLKSAMFDLDILLNGSNAPIR